MFVVRIVPAREDLIIEVDRYRSDFVFAYDGIVVIVLMASGNVFNK